MNNKVIQKYDKLIRDKIPTNLEKKGIEVKTRIAGEAEYLGKLKDKLLEEANEFIEDESKEELADVLEVFYALLEVKGYTKEEIENIRIRKAEQKGSFNNRIILEETRE